MLKTIKRKVRNQVISTTLVIVTVQQLRKYLSFIRVHGLTVTMARLSPTLLAMYRNPFIHYICFAVTMVRLSPYY